MKKLLILILFIPLVCNSHKPAPSFLRTLPIRLSLSPQGLLLSAASTIATKLIGKAIGNGMFNIFKSTSFGSPSYSSYGYTGSYFNSTNSVTNYEVKGYDFILIIVYNYTKYIYTLNGFEEIEITTEGTTVIKAGKEKLEVDLTNAELDKVIFKGKSFSGSSGQIINQMNNEIGQTSFNDIITILNYHDGIAFAYTNKSTFVILDQSMNIITELPYTDIVSDSHKSELIYRGFVENGQYPSSKVNFNKIGLIGVKCTNNLWGFIDRKFNLVIPCRFGSVGIFNETSGLCRVYLKNNYFNINTKGEIVSSFK